VVRLAGRDVVPLSKTLGRCELAAVYGLLSLGEAGELYFGEVNAVERFHWLHLAEWEDGGNNKVDERQDVVWQVVLIANDRRLACVFVLVNKILSVQGGFQLAQCCIKVNSALTRR